MRDMKNSGIEWLGMIPEHWSVPKITHILDYKHPYPIGDGDHGSIKATDYATEGIPFIRVQNLGYATALDLSDVVYITEEQNSNIKNSTLYPGDVLFAKTGATIGKVGIVPPGITRANTTSHVGKITVGNDVSPRFVYYVLSSYVGYKQFWDVAAQKSTRPELSIDETRMIRVVLPPSKEEQILIASFLDTKCAEIDAVVTDIQAQIDTLELYKRSIITEAVTKGLTPHAETRESGVANVPQIPKEWKSTRFKYVATVMSNLVEPSGYQDYPQVSPDNIEKNSGKLLSYNTVEESGVISGNHLFYAGQILYSKIRPNLNKVAIAPFDGLCSADMYPIETKLNTKFTLYMMLSNYFVEQVSIIIHDRVKMPKINQEELGGIRTIVPPLKIQAEIVSFLDDKCTKINAIIAAKREQLETLDSYKKSVIFEYVTGKKEV